MELTGDLSDFALTDILQILALSRKTGTLSVEAGSLFGKVVIEDGRVTYASVEPGETLLERLVRESKITEDMLGDLKIIGVSDSGVWSLESLIVESGLMTEGDLKEFVKRQIQYVVGKLVGVEKGRFGISLNEIDDKKTLSDITFCEGLDVREALLGAAKVVDEEAGVLTEGRSYQGIRRLIHNNNNLESDNENRNDIENYWQIKSKSVIGNQKGLEEVEDKTSLLCSLLTELRSYAFEAEVILIIMRYASEVASRGILFVVKDNEICGLGQYGIRSKLNGVSADECVRDVRIPLSEENIFGEVALTRVPYIGEVPEYAGYKRILRPVGGIEKGASIFILPVVCHGKSVFIIYGDGDLSSSSIRGIDGLQALVNQAGVILEKIVLERMLDQVRVRERGFETENLQ